jgi:hypothetical protein
MPPSGYSENQSRSVAEFLRSCVKDLTAENRGLRSPKEALSREITSIRKDLDSSDRPAVEVKVLELTGAFYRELLGKNSADFDALTKDAEACLTRVKNGVEAIKIVEESA